MICRNLFKQSAKRASEFVRSSAPKGLPKYSFCATESSFFISMLLTRNTTFWTRPAEELLKLSAKDVDLLLLIVRHTSHSLQHLCH